jgi:photosystem II stability/assembly factor-like uncharacterized protein
VKVTDQLVFNSSQGSIFIQPGGPGTPLHWLGCHDVEDLEAPKGEIEIELCRDANGNYFTVGQRKGPPEPITTSLVGLTGKTRTWLEKLECDGVGALYLMLMSCLRMDNPTNWDRAWVLQRINITGETITGLAHHVESNQTTQTFPIQAWPPLIRAAPSVVDRIAVAEVLSINDIWGDKGRCVGPCGTGADPGDIAAFVPDSAVGPSTGNVDFTTDGITFTAGATDPFGAGLHTMAIQAFSINRAGRRWLVAKEALAGQQGQVAYSDDAGATWTAVSVGGAAAGHGAVYGGSLWAPRSDFCFLVGRVGYIYRSTDGGQTWAAVDAGVVTAGSYSGVHFADDKYGAAVAAAGVVAITRDGGETWSAATVINGGAAGNLTVHVFNSSRIMVGDDAGRLWQSTDFGTTWTQITGWTGSGAGDVRSIDFIDDFVGFMAHNTVAPVGTVLRTIDGGANWLPLTTPTNSGLNRVFALSTNMAYAVGEANGGTGVLLKVQEE